MSDKRRLEEMCMLLVWLLTIAFLAYAAIPYQSMPVRFPPPAYQPKLYSYENKSLEAYPADAESCTVSVTRADVDSGKCGNWEWNYAH